MNNAIKRNQSQSNMELDIISDKLNSILQSLNPDHLKSDYDDKVVEDEAHKFDGITYENKVLSESINGKIKHNNDLIDQIMLIVIKPKEEIVDPPIPILEEVKKPIPPPTQMIREGEDPAAKKRGGFQKGHKLSTKEHNDGL